MRLTSTCVLAFLAVAALFYYFPANGPRIASNLVQSAVRSLDGLKEPNDPDESNDSVSLPKPKVYYRVEETIYITDRNNRAGTADSIPKLWKMARTEFGESIDCIDVAEYKGKQTKRHTAFLRKDERVTDTLLVLLSSPIIVISDCT